MKLYSLSLYSNDDVVQDCNDSIVCDVDGGIVAVVSESCTAVSSRVLQSNLPPRPHYKRESPMYNKDDLHTRTGSLTPIRGNGGGSTSVTAMSYGGTLPGRYCLFLI